jgi:hypothetical protein
MMLGRPISLGTQALRHELWPLDQAGPADQHWQGQPRVYGEATFQCVEGKVPQGMIFCPYGPPSCKIMGNYTDGTGMPTSKGWEVEVEPVDA